MTVMGSYRIKDSVTKFVIKTVDSLSRILKCLNFALHSIRRLIEFTNFAVRVSKNNYVNAEDHKSRYGVCISHISRAKKPFLKN